MELDDRKEHIIRCIKLGMDLDSSMYCAECTASEIELLRKDEDFTGKVKTYQSIEEYNVLEDFDSAMGIALAKGQTAAAQWKLSKINKKRWGNETEDKGKEDANSMVIILPTNGREE
jgi:uncharacterized membrane protein YkoI